MSYHAPLPCCYEQVKIEINKKEVQLLGHLPGELIALIDGMRGSPFVDCISLIISANTLSTFTHPPLYCKIKKDDWKLYWQIDSFVVGI